ncbi:MAG TPA: hypothetical protein VKE88_01340, partial [Candidatus Nanoarchaeia archaeon]|nr:hypothetical protein [Candidatus Nanoarchaeia archaeon]
LSGLGFISPQLTTVDTCGYYNWSVVAYDGADYGNYSSLFNFSIQSYIDIFLTQNLSDFGNMQIFDTNDTVDNNPLPFMVQSDSNVYVNVSTRALDELWTTSGLGNNSFRFKAANSTEVGSFNDTFSQMTYVPVFSSNRLAIHRLNFHNSTDTAEIDLEVTVPGEEPPGQKSSILIVEGAQS